MARVYDLVMTHKLDADDYFIHRVQEYCAAAGLNFFLVEPLWAEAFLARLEGGDIRVRVLLNMHSEHHDPQELFHRLVRAAAARGVRVIDPPEVALAAFNTATMHARLVAAGMDVPATVVVTDATAVVDDQQLAPLGRPFVIKPAFGYGRRGVVLDAQTGADLARCAAAWPTGPFLLQQRIQPRLIQGEPAYFRAYFAFGSTWLSWWNCHTDRYRLVAPEEAAGLSRLHELVQQVAALSGMSFFSTEVAGTEDGRWVLIDYVNDQCHLLTQSASPANGVPDVLVNALARRLVEGAAEWIRS